MSEFSEKIRKYRLARQLSINDLARALGVSKPTVWAWEHARATPRPERFVALAQILQVPVEALESTRSMSDAQAEVVRECKEKIARAFALDSAAVRIRIDL
jgi:transcriptional regulator with XRE-family HTH domain